MKVTPVILAVAVLAFAAGVKNCSYSQAERAAIRAPKPEKPRPVTPPPVQPKPTCTENCPRTNDDQTVVISPIPGGVPMGGGVYMSVR